MISKSIQDELNKLKSTDSDTFSLITKILDMQSDEMSYASHEIKNTLSFLNSSCQIVESHHPEINNFEFWNEITSAVHSLVSYMERTTLYRYSTHFNPEPTCINNLLYSLPDQFDNICPDNSCEFSFDTDIDNIFTECDINNLKTSFLEIIKNAYDNIGSNCKIDILMHLLDSNKIKIEITGSPYSIIPDKFNNSAEDVTEKWCAPFYTTKSHHSGLGLSIVYNTCTKHNADFKIMTDNNNTSVATILLPVHNK